MNFCPICGAELYPIAEDVLTCRRGHHWPMTKKDEGSRAKLRLYGEDFKCAALSRGVGHPRQQTGVPRRGFLGKGLGITPPMGELSARPWLWDDLDSDRTPRWSSAIPAVEPPGELDRSVGRRGSNQSPPGAYPGEKV